MRIHFEQNQRLIDQYLIHSFLYYRLNETLITDTEYDQIIIALNDAAPAIWEQPLEFANIVQKGLELGAYSIKNYPISIVSVAIHLIYHQQYDEIIGFDEYLSRLGYEISSTSI